MDQFSAWWEKATKISAATTGCSKADCAKIAQSVCETTFDNFKDPAKSLVPELNVNKLSDIIKVVRPLGGGKSGAYLFVIRLKIPGRVFTSDSEKTYVLKLYATAYNKLGRVNDTRPFREVYTQCAMSGTSGYNCLLAFAQAPWSAVQELFAVNTNELYKEGGIMQSGFLKNETLADGRALQEIPAKVLFMISTFTKGVPLLNLNMIKHGNDFPGIVLNIMATHQKAERRLGHFTHWDLHADNIFIDTNCQVRSFLPLATIGEFPIDDFWKQLEALSPSPEHLAAFKEKVWIPITRSIKDALTQFRKTIKEVNLVVDPLVVSEFSTPPQSNVIYTIGEHFRDFLKRKITYPGVTLIDFDLAYSDQFPEQDHVHAAKAASPLPMAERTLAWLCKWIPAAHVVNLIKTFLLIRPKLPDRQQSDVLHMIVYVVVALVYWDLIGNGSSEVPKTQLPERLDQLHLRCNMVINEIKKILSLATKFSIDNVRAFMVESVQKFLPMRCGAPMYCGYQPLANLNYFQLSAIVVGSLQKCVENPTYHALCTYRDAFESAINKWNSSRVMLTKVLKTIHAALLSINLVHFTLYGRFVNSDDTVLQIEHQHTPAELFAHIEFDWKEIQSQFAFGFFTKILMSQYTQGRLSIGIKSLKNTVMHVSLKNGADLTVDVKTGLQLNFFAYTEPGNKHNVIISRNPTIDNLEDSPPIDAALPKNNIGSITLESFSLSKVGTVVEIRVTMNVIVKFTGITINKFIDFILFFVKMYYSFSQDDLKLRIENVGGTSKVSMIITMPPSDEPIHPCVGFAMDTANINMGLNCLSTQFAEPNLMTQLKAAAHMEDDIAASTQEILRWFLNELDAKIVLKSADIAVPVWNMKWERNGPSDGMFSLHEIVQEPMRIALMQYLKGYKGLPVPVEEFKPETKAIYDDLPELTEGKLKTTDSIPFNLKYVQYLAQFIEDDDEFVDAEDGI